MQYTLLDLTQTIQSSMDGDEINSISDTPESLQIVKVIRTAYFDIINRSKLPEHFDLFSLEASGDSTKPVLMTVPSGFRSVEWLKYDCVRDGETNLDMQFVSYLAPEDFLNRMHNLSEDDDTVESFIQTIGTSIIKFLYNNDSAPRYYTSFDDGTVIFDSYDSEVDTTLQKSKTVAYGQKVITWTESDTFIPDLDDDQFPLLLNEAKSLAWAELRQTVHQKAELSAKRNWVSLKKNKNTVKGLSDFDQLPNFGRR